MDEMKAKVRDILLRFNSHAELQWDDICNENSEVFIDRLVQYLNSNTKWIDVECIIQLLCALSKKSVVEFVPEHVVFGIVDIMHLCKFSGKSVSRLLDVLRTGARTLNSKDDNIDCIAFKYHKHILETLQRAVLDDNPFHVSFPGDKESFVQVSGIPISCQKAYTMAVWLKISATGGGGKGFILFRCRSPTSGIDAIVSTVPEQEGQYVLTLRTNSERKGKGEVQCKLTLTPEKWHLVTVQQFLVAWNSAEKVSVAVDGVVAVETDLYFPFSATPNESLWVFGLGFRGHMASIALYPDEVPADLLQLLHSLGPYISDLSLGVSCPQTSFDTGHMVLGTQIAKGRLASKAYKSIPIFTVKAANLLPDAALPLSSTGKLYQEHIEMVPRLQEYDAPLLVSMAGGCAAVLGGSVVEAWSEASGMALLLYLFWAYSAACSGKLYQVGAAGTKLSEVAACLKAVVQLGASLVQASGDFKEQLVQMHGFHVMGYCLSSLSTECRRQLVDRELVDLCVDLVRALGPDARKGDGIAAALQGLLFDFRIWGSCSVFVLKYYLEHLASLLLDCGHELYISVGLQRILDVFRLHVARLTAGATANSTLTPDLNKVGGVEEFGPDAVSGSNQLCVIECADAMHRMLIIVMDAARAHALKSGANLSTEAEKLLLCLEETSSCLIAERLLRLIGNMRVTSPNSLLQAMVATRFHDTVVLTLLSKKGFSVEVRSSALVNLFWLFGEELRTPLQQVAQSRKLLNTIITAFSVSGTKGNKHVAGRSKTMSNVDVSRVKSLTSQIRESVKPLEKAWVIIGMLVEVLTRALNEGAWGKQYPSCLSSCEEATRGYSTSKPLLGATQDPATAALATAEVDTLINVFTHSGQMEAWLLLPLLSVLLPRAGLNSCQHVLMSLNVMFKTDSCQAEALSSLPDRSWIQLMVSLACIGESHNQRLLRSDADRLHDGFVATSQTSGHRGGSGYSADADVAATCTELALDCLSIVVEYKTRFHCNESWSTWNCLQNCIKSSCTAQFGDTDLAEVVELKFLKRCVSLVFQRLAKSTEGWNTNIITVVVNVLTFVDNRRLCGAAPVPTVVVHKQLESLLDMDYGEPAGAAAAVPLFKVQTSDEGQILCFAMDMMASLRKAADRGALDGAEWPAMKLANKIILSCLACVSESIADRISNEILAYLKFASQPQAHFSGSSFKAALMQILSELRSVVKSLLVPDYLRGRYSALVFSIMHFFIEVRHAQSEGKRVADHVVPVVDALVGIDNCNDLDLIFKLLDVSMFKATSISFEDAEAEEHPAPDLSKAVASGSAVLLDMLDIAVPSSPPDAPSIDSDSVHAGDGCATASSVVDEDLHDSEDELTPPTTKEVLSVEQMEQQAREYKFAKWLKTRQGISSERVDSERAKLARSMDTLDLSSEATKKFWKKARRKVESEIFLEAHKCQWKLGVAHEGHFPGRKRVVLRPRFDNEYGAVGDTSWGQSSALCASEDASAAASEELTRALAKACAGYITDVTRDESGNDPDEIPSVKEANKAEQSTKERPEVKVPGSGWGLVDADGSEDGYGVVGLILTETTPTEEVTRPAATKGVIEPSAAPMPVHDLMGDVKQVEENFRQGKGNATGPCLRGTRRVDSGAAVLDANVILITASGNFWGSLSFNGKEIFFNSTFDAESGHRDDTAAVTLVKQERMRRRRWVLSSVSAIYLRRFRLRDSAMEVFFSRGKHRNFFVDFGHTRENAKQRNEFAKALMTAAPSSAFKQLPTMSHFRLVYDHGVQDKWLSGRMSNFDYLMALNTIAGRSYNDLCQYPVFPWVLSDYSSASLDLTNKAVYRDLSKPMGALNETRLHEFLDRFNSFGENVTSGIPPFMYGSHYSTMVGVVLHFLVRLQPFAALHKEMQNGHFDVPDRLFSSIPRSYKHNTTQLSEVKELTPEWFTTPEIFKNVNRFSFGKTQDDEVVDDVELPPWAASAEDFVRIHREALESDYVSEHLHEWIDLIFGYKQRGPDSVDASNVFYYLTYYGSVDHYMIEDETLRKATELQIAHFGQIPMQLFKIPHPARKLSGSGAQLPLTRPLKKCYSTVDTEALVKPSCDEECVAIEAAATVVNKNTNTTTLSVSVLTDRLLCVLDNGVVEVLKFSTSEEAKSALMMVAAAPKQPNPTSKKHIATKETEVVTADIISFDDPFDLFGSSEAVKAEKDGTPNGSRGGSFDTLPARNHNILDKYEPLVFVEKEFTHFDVVPRIPLPKSLKLRAVCETHVNSLEKLCKGRPSPSSSESKIEQAASLILFTKSGSIVLSVGHVDGRVSVRELDTRTGFVKSAGDFRAHKRRIVSLATDTIPFANTDVVATIDEAGQLMVWTISKVRGATNVTYNYVISRRPQRVFRCEPSSDLYCDISWQMGIVVAVCGVAVRIYSIERDEQLRYFQMDLAESSPKAAPAETQVVDDEQLYPEFTYTGPEHLVFGAAAHVPQGDSTGTSVESLTRRVVLSDCGVIVVHVETFRFVESLVEYEDQLQHQHLLVAYSLSGSRTGFLSVSSPVTHLSCPDRGDVVISGHQDGSVCFYRPQDLKLFHKFSPHTCCTHLSLSLTPSKTGAAQKTANKSSAVGSGVRDGKPRVRSLLTDASPIVSVCVGPNKAFPALVCVTTESGNIFFKALPDFVKWERTRSPSALAQLASVPIQAVRGTLQQAHNWTAETAGVLAHNARSFADEAMGELKKMKRNSVVKGVASFFGLGRGNTEADEDSK